jgi:hypothetical protein
MLHIIPIVDLGDRKETAMTTVQRGLLDVKLQQFVHCIVRMAWRLTAWLTGKGSCTSASVCTNNYSDLIDVSLHESFYCGEDGAMDNCSNSHAVLSRSYLLLSAWNLIL